MIAEPVRDASAPLARVLGALPTARHVGRGWQARCPAHEDRRASLSITEGDDGRVLLKCFATCETAAVLRAAGLDWGDLFPADSARRSGHAPVTPKRRVVATYDYRHADGHLDFQVVRLDPKDFRQRRPDPTQLDGWAWKAGDRGLIYRLPELLAAPADAWVFVAEGEKDVERLAALGLVATCNAGGAGKWSAANAEHLRERRVAIPPDNDDAGRKHAVQVAASLEGLAADVRIVELPGLPIKGDVSDWLAAGGTAAQLADLAEAAPRWRSAEAAEDDCGCLTCAAIFEAKDRRIAELERHISQMMEAMGNPELSPTSKLAGMALAFEVFSAAERGNPEPIVTRARIAERIGVKEEAAGRALEPLCGEGAPFAKRPTAREKPDPATGEVLPVRNRTLNRWSAQYADLGATLRAIRDHAPATPRKHGGTREPDPLRCPRHPEAGTETRQTTYCLQCRAALDAPRVAGEVPHLGVPGETPDTALTCRTTTAPHLGVPPPSEPPASDSDVIARLQATVDAQRERYAAVAVADSPPRDDPAPAASARPVLRVICPTCGGFLEGGGPRGRCPACDGPPPIEPPPDDPGVWEGVL